MIQTIWVSGNEIDKSCVIGFGPLHTVLGYEEFTLWTKYGPINIHRHPEDSLETFIRDRDAAIKSWRKWDGVETLTDSARRDDLSDPVRAGTFRTQRGTADVKSI